MGVKVDFKVNVPHGEMDITENGQYDVSDYAIANVNVDNKEQICNAEVTIPIDNLKEAINNYSNIWVDDTNTAKIVINDTEFSSNNQMFHSFISSMYVVFQFDINY